MANFYDEWLGLWKKNVEEREKARKVIYPEELKWERTKQDHKSALLISPKTGFKTLGGLTMVSEIPPGWKTGKHSHGEEAIFITKGSGFSIVNGRRYNWEEGSCMRIPFGATHQHFNAGTEPAQYFSAMAPYFEYFCNIAKFEHLEDCGEYSKGPAYEGEGQASDFDKEGRRIVLHMNEAVAQKKDDKNIGLMRGFPDLAGEEVMITDVLMDPPLKIQEKHAHMEAMLYFLKGEGYSIIDGKKYPWRQGTALHVQGPQTVHQHFTVGSSASHMLRTEFNLRRRLEPLAKDVFPYLHHLEGEGNFMAPFVPE